jgi:hypothetical protein
MVHKIVLVASKAMITDALGEYTATRGVFTMATKIVILLELPKRLLHSIFPNKQLV